MIPPLGTRWRFEYGAGAERTWELVERVSEREARNRGQHGCDRNRLKLTAESGFLPEHAAKPGSEMYVEDRWFLTHRSGQASAAEADTKKVQRARRI